MLKQLLDYWYSLEFFQPTCPRYDKRRDIDLIEKSLPWPDKNSNPEKKMNYDIYFGCATAYDFIVWMLKQLKIREEDTRIEPDPSQICVCALKVDENGKYVNDSFSVCSFIWGLWNIVNAKDFSAKLNHDDLKQFEDDVNTKLTERGTPFLSDDLQLFFKDVCKELSHKNNDALQIEFEQICKNLSENSGYGSKSKKPWLWTRKKELNKKKNGDFPEIEPATELISSFYLSDMDRVMNNPSKQIRHYVEAFNNKQSRIEIDNDTTEMQQWLEARCFPLGLWPSTHSPSLMQQLAINLAISSKQSIFSVNGPPGTGKTTLLKEIIASNIVRRAKCMAKYTDPDDAFKKHDFTHPPDQYNKTFYKPDHDLTTFGILVASNNNAAVENISLELPKTIREDRTGHFSEPEDNYFADIASALLNENAWGLISVRLGKTDNLRKFKAQLWRDGGNVPLKMYYDNPPDWETAKKKFHKALDAVNNERTNIAKVQNKLDDYFKIVEVERAEKDKADDCRDKMRAQTILRDELQTQLNRLAEDHSLQMQNAAMLKASLSWFKRLLPRLFKNNPLVCEWKRTEKTAVTTLISIIRQQTTLQGHENLLKIRKEKLNQQEMLLKKIQDQIRDLEVELNIEREQFGSNFADEEFWTAISKNEASQTACPWTHEKYNALREKLFYHALMLNKAFVLNSNSIKQNLMRLRGMWDKVAFIQEDREKAFGSLINTLFFVVPVISTTFAAVQTFLKYVHPSELGTLVVDESGQATPQSALGAIWRTRKAIIVGDPLQVEPIMTAPVELCRRFADVYGLSTEYKTPELSVQMLADAQNIYGGKREIGGNQLWLGCPLVVHRRCIEPMFSMSNKVAYDERMFCKTQPPSPDKQFLLEKSSWFNVFGQEIGNKDHTVENQIKLLASLMEEAITKYDGLPNLYIITPFTTVKRSLVNKLHPLLKEHLPDLEEKERKMWIEDNCGTIHTFQGKEANEVIIVLGCDGDQGKGAVSWVGQKPNIINVAVSRAKYRLGMIGSYELWKNVPHVKIVCDMLKDSIRHIPPPILHR